MIRCFIRGASSSSSKLKVETSGSTSTGTVLPNIIAGGAVSAIATSPAVDEGKTVAPVFSKAKRNSFFGELFGIDCSTTAIVYIGTPGETAEETAKRMEAIQKISEANAKAAEKKTEDAANVAASTENTDNSTKKEDEK